MAAVDGKGEFAFHTQLRSDEDEATITDERAADLFREACGVNIDCEVLSQWAGQPVILLSLTILFRTA